MSNKVGGIELTPEFGGLELINKPATSVPQELATAFGEINEGLLGATYTPLWVVGKQVVNGVNYYVICKEVRATKETNTLIVNLVIHIPSVKSDGTKPKARIDKIIEEATLDADIARIFQSAMTITGVGYTPLAYIGKQIVNGTNHFFICQAKTIYPGSEPFAAFVGIHTTRDNHSSLLFVKPLNVEELVGYAFTW